MVRRADKKLFARLIVCGGENCPQCLCVPTVSWHTNLSLALEPSAKHGEKSERRHGGVLGFGERARDGRATFIFSLQLSNYHTVKLYKKWNCLGVGKFDSWGLGRQATLIFSAKLSNCQTIKLPNYQTVILSARKGL